MDVIGREDEFVLQNKNAAVPNGVYDITHRNDGKKVEFREFNSLMCEISAEKRHTHLFKNYGYHHPKSGGKIESMGFGFEATTPAVPLKPYKKLNKWDGKKLSSPQLLTLSSLVHRFILIELFMKARNKTRLPVGIDAWSTHENVNAKTCRPGEISKAIRDTIGPAITCLGKSYNSYYPAFLTVNNTRKETEGETNYKMEFVVEYMPIPHYLSALNSYLVAAVKTFEEMINSPRDLYNAYRLFGYQINYFRDCEAASDRVSLSPLTTEPIQESGLDYRIPIITNGKMIRRSIRKVFRDSLQFFRPKLELYSAPEDISLLEAIAAGDEQAYIEMDEVEHYSNITNTYRKNLGITNFDKFVVKNSKIGLQGWTD